ncbi:Helix-turn-helix domain-containing protein [Lentzea xinjiangensis]|uniref:Helix-turn-helix domain-containing protein n=1 Tax=Lentzea xinjiangensis TaxID=402600 RepID=A0A1H9W4P7_9PSEU|nr:helix-turn-helix domain-containing protein [Lentzea xinjiangensis]SES28845.1 Helix-turn-helix domain-containing protein [Lentzea xinjiangensis]
MSDVPPEGPDIDRNVAVNLRQFREQRGVSQDELAQRMSERGFGFTQATIWKIERGQRPVKISEAVALGKALGLSSWTHLTEEPALTRRLSDLQDANRRANEAYTETKAAAARFFEAQVNVVVAVREAQDAGLDTERWNGWVNIPAERAVIEARVEWNREDDILERREKEVEAVLAALRQHGYPLIQPEDVEFGGGRP